MNFDVAGSDEGFSTDAESLCSYDSGSMYPSHQDLLSISSSDYDSAICSPKSLTLDREYEQLALEQLSLEGSQSDDEADATDTSCAENSIIETQMAIQTIVGAGNELDDEEDTRRERSSTLLAS